MVLAYIFTFILVSIVLTPRLLPLAGAIIRQKSSARRAELLSVVGTQDGKQWTGIVGFFHPFCNAGGGGERVLWAAIRATQLRWPNAVCVVYTGDNDVTRDQMLKRVEDRFDIRLNPRTVHFLHLSTRKYVLASTWPRFTLIGQSLGSLLLAVDAFSLLTPDVLVDTMGYAFVLYLSKLLFPKVPTGAYVHYPTISTDMLDSLDGDDDDAGRGLNAGAGKGFKGQLKRRYWQWFASAYSRVGRSVDVVMTNSSWTQGHIQQLWGSKTRKDGTEVKSTVVFPPVAVEELEEKIKVGRETEGKRKPHLLYIAQFRPEKNHALVLQAFAKFVKGRKDKAQSSGQQQQPRLVLVGSVRDDADSKRVYKLRLLAHELLIKDQVDFICDAPWPQVLEQLSSASVGVNSMWNEHFGIGVVEYQAAGLISVVNNSGGPRMDIVVEIDGQPTGFHASTVEEYASAFEKALSLGPTKSAEMRIRARESAQRFTEEVFAKKWIENLKSLLELQEHSAS